MSRLYSLRLGNSDETNMSHVFNPPSGTFLRSWFDQMRPRPMMVPPRGWLRWVSGYTPAPSGTVMKPTCHMFLISLVEHFSALGLTTCGIGPRWHPHSWVPRWVSSYRPAPWGTVMKPTFYMFLIHLVEHFCAFGLTT